MFYRQKVISFPDNSRYIRTLLPMSKCNPLPFTQSPTSMSPIGQVRNFFVWFFCLFQLKFLRFGKTPTEMLLISLFCWLYYGDRYKMLVTEWIFWRFCSSFGWFLRCVKSVTNISNLPYTRFVSNVREGVCHQHRCKRKKWTKNYEPFGSLVRSEQPWSGGPIFFLNGP